MQSAVRSLFPQPIALTYDNETLSTLLGPLHPLLLRTRTELWLVAPKKKTLAR
jgi:hypothetical protein